MENEEKSIDWKILKMRAQLSVLKDVERVYGSCSIGNVIQQLTSILKYLEKEKEKEELYGKEKTN